MPNPGSNAMVESRSSTITKCPSLPAEVWRIVFSVGDSDVHGGFESTYDYPTMASICLSCTLFRDLVRPWLYHNFDSHVFSDDWYCFGVAEFARTICTNPHLASMVRKVNVQGVCDMDHMFARPPVTADNPDHPTASVLIKRAAELGMDFKYHEVYTDRENRNVGSDLVALILAQLPKLDTLYLEWLDTPQMAHMPQPRQGWPWAQSIRKVVLRPTSTADPTRESHRQLLPPTACYSFSLVLPLLCSGGSLTRLSLINIMGPDVTLPLDNLREATMLSSQFRPGQVINLLKHCSRLRKFIYSSAPAFTGPSPREFIEALVPAHSSLEVLGIDLYRCDDYGWTRISSLKQFTVLKTLYIDVNCIWDQEAAADKDSPPSPDMILMTLLPESIEEVALFGGDPDVDNEFKVKAHIKRLASEKKDKGGFQRLKRLRAIEYVPVEPDPGETGRSFARRVTTLNEAKTQLGDDEVQIIFDDEDSDLDFFDITLHSY